MTVKRRPYTSSKVSSARKKAYECLERIRVRNAFASDVIDSIIDRASLDSSDRAFATRLVLGVVSMKGTLDYVIDRCLRSPKDVKPNVRDALRISTYEILYLDKSPHAAVDQGVELVRSIQPKACGLANAVLHKILNAKRTFPFDDPSKDVKAFALLHGFPVWLAEKLINNLGPKGAHSFMRASNEAAPIFLSINSLKGNVASTLSEIEDLGTKSRPVSIEDIEVDGCIQIENAKVLAHDNFKRMVSEGRVLVSDAAAQAIAQIAVTSAEDATSCLELCAGRGTKTVLLQKDAYNLNSKQYERFVAVDNVSFKTKLLEKRASEYGAFVSESLCIDLLDEKDALKGELFDLVFLDSPCSGLGTLRRHPEIRWRITPEVIAENAKRDEKLIAAAASHVSPGGVLAYSTCTVTKEENENVVNRFLNSADGADFALVQHADKPMFATHLTSGSCDAHFCAIMQRKRVI